MNISKISRDPQRNTRVYFQNQNIDTSQITTNTNGNLLWMNISKIWRDPVLFVFWSCFRLNLNGHKRSSSTLRPCILALLLFELRRLKPRENYIMYLYRYNYFLSLWMMFNWQAGVEVTTQGFCVVWIDHVFMLLPHDPDGVMGLMQEADGNNRPLSLLSGGLLVDMRERWSWIHDLGLTTAMMLFIQRHVLAWDSAEKVLWSRKHSVFALRYFNRLIALNSLLQV